jgi:hypothetical protein
MGRGGRTWYGQIADHDILTKMQAVDRLLELDKTTIIAALGSSGLKSQVQPLVHVDDSTVAAGKEVQTCMRIPLSKKRWRPFSAYPTQPTRKKSCIGSMSWKAFASASKMPLTENPIGWGGAQGHSIMVRWTARAKAQLGHIHDYIAQNSALYAKRVSEKQVRKPSVWMSCPVKGTRTRGTSYRS